MASQESVTQAAEPQPEGAALNAEEQIDEASSGFETAKEDSQASVD